MKIFNYIVIGLFCLAVLFVLFFALRTKKFFKTILTSSLIGVSSVLILHFTSMFTGFTLEITPFTIIFSSIFGMPGVVVIVICKMIFGI